jgi:diamine N-acetyltransferase
MEIRKATIKDIGSIQNIAKQTWPSAYGDIISPEQINYMLELMYSTEVLENQMDTSQAFLIIQDEGQDMAFVSFEHNYSSELQTKIHKIYISPDAQGKGLGRILLEETEREAINKQSKRLILNVNRQNKAISFYEKSGFKIAFSEDIEIGNGFQMNDYVMIKNITK